jgi:hypothetical protein
LAAAHASEQRGRTQEQQMEGRNPRAAIEATVHSVKHPFPVGKLPLHGTFPLDCMLIGSTAVSNVLRFQRGLFVEADQYAARSDGLDSHPRSHEFRPRRFFWLIFILDI